MRLAVISDTHDAIFSTQDVLKMITAEGVDTIIHCGDMTTAYTAELFTDFCVYHALGNNDYDSFGISDALRRCKPGSRSDRWYKGMFDGKMIGAVHEEHSREFAGMMDSGIFNYIFVGHTHRKSDRTVGKTRIINPGAIGGAHRGERGFLIIDFATGEINDYTTE
ncbi:MAG: metallophosphoesterase family protein [Anaerolineaceae bacterium]|nr:metallophosphoesterase family protein [Anaerolineaceae bacterium]